MAGKGAKGSKSKAHGTSKTWVKEPKSMTKAKKVK